MSKISVPYGKMMQEAIVSDEVEVEVIDINVPEITATEEQLVKEALDYPIGIDRVENLVKKEDQVVIVVNDHTRPGPNKIIVKELVTRLSGAGIPDENIRFIFATGSHRASTDEEIANIIGAEYRDRYQAIMHNCLDKDSLTYLGETVSGMPLYVNKAVVESSFVITTGLIAPHHSAGFSGGRKSIVPGVAGIETLKIHHSLPIRPFNPAMGFMYGNPFHEAALEAAKKVNVGFMVNAVQDPHKQNIAFVAGDIELAHAKGVEICKKVSEVEICGLADIVITSPGGYPRDCNLYQAQKALSVAEPLGKPNCIYILMANAEDGIGEGVFREWMVEAKTSQEVVERFRREGYNVGSNKAFMYARAMTKGKVMVVSENLKEKDLKEMMFEWAPNLQEAIKKAMSERDVKKMIVLPRAVNIIPCVN
ncbi:nickel-dependent lactate racemase [Petroclostridium sp. X23]|uniref:nickel-dependent lactate racemase n=1 Tax=Petroclostridium sp. X23 TaxID=3045146 RepID=UPI0024AC9597|nr:nickel-dependent lactate racemase [Petroclostridium sp. X23]WHH61202.1 nickel-dependent lactate racemase [Petroclostridium sp. X23]